jgi:hypothetical protein
LFAMKYEIVPEPDEETRRAILAALASDEAEQARASAWAERLLPRRDDEPDEAV